MMIKTADKLLMETNVLDTTMSTASLNGNNIIRIAIKCHSLDGDNTNTSMHY